ncbi:HD domain-containing phosphohydrolase [Deinococcus radiophilus]|uniref:HD domain-containing phosphohydrolase n=2 Tax=Deinococcus radiophilus TaxID=32062 RepID=UPI00269B091D|nr:HD domain-containing phosphohydrolase [Deinococcus radiophilus]
MFRFNRPKKDEAPGASDERVLVAAQNDPTRVLADLLGKPNVEGLLEGALEHAASLLGGNVKGYAVLRKGQDTVSAVRGYPKTLLGLSLSGPWAQMRPRLLADGPKELYSMNTQDVVRQLDAAGMNEVSTTVIVPLVDKGRNVGALILDQFQSGGVSQNQQEALNRWGSAVTPLLSVFDTREEWRQGSRQLTIALVEAVESQDFDALGHAQQVADISGQLGRQLGLNERELEQLWYGAILHDVGKINGDQGHASIGANFLHAVPHLADAQKAIRHHHEHFDGSGEPDKLVGEDIPLYARIIAVANALVHVGDAARLKGQAGKNLDPRLVELAQKLPPRS